MAEGNDNFLDGSKGSAIEDTLWMGVNNEPGEVSILALGDLNNDSSAEADNLRPQGKKGRCPPPEWITLWSRGKPIARGL